MELRPLGVEGFPGQPPDCAGVNLLPGSGRLSASSGRPMARYCRFIALGPMFLMLGAAGEPISISRAFGNTIVSTYPDNRQAKLWLAPSGSYTALGPAGDHSRGRWKIKGSKLCLKQIKPPTPPFFHYCTPIPSREEWSTKAVTGETIQVRIVRGSQASSR